MKALAFSVLIIAVVTNSYAQTRLTPHEWHATLRVVDDTGAPVADALAWASYDVPPQSGQTKDWEQIRGQTDTNGVFCASHTDRTVQLGFHAEKAGYYPIWTQHYLGFEVTNTTANWNSVQMLVLKRIRNPIAMFAKRVEGGPPAFNEPVGYDLMIGDWVAPRGKGREADIIFVGQLDKKSTDDFDYSLTVKFPKSGDGIQTFVASELEKSSPLRSPYEAPADGYQDQVVRTMTRHPGQRTKEDMNDPSRNYFFRVRTVLDENGNVKSALYGKIYGDFMQFRYYLNPTPNDRNIEFDPKHNLLKGLKSLEEVREP